MQYATYLLYIAFGVETVLSALHILQVTYAHRKEYRGFRAYTTALACLFIFTLCIFSAIPLSAQVMNPTMAFLGKYQIPLEILKELNTYILRAIYFTTLLPLMIFSEKLIIIIITNNGNVK